MVDSQVSRKFRDFARSTCSRGSLGMGVTKGIGQVSRRCI